MVMQSMRKATKPIVWFVALAFVGTIFLAWGMDFTSRPGERGIIGEVSGTKIQDEQYRQVLNYMYYQRNEQKPGQELTDAEARQMRDDAFSTIVNETMFANERKRLGLELPDNELVEHLRRFPPDFLRSNPSFANEAGSFDYPKYQQAMLDPQLGQFWSQVEGIIRPQVQQMKLQEYVVSMTHITDPEVRLFFDAAGVKRKVRYVAVPFADYANKLPDPDSAAVRAYFQEHQDDYRQKEMAELYYVMFMKKPSPEDTAIVLNELADVRRQVEEGADFNELARTYSDEPSAVQSGGDLGWFARGRMVKPFEDAAFALEVGQLSEPVLSRFGYHLIKLQEKRTVNDTDQVHASHILMKLEPSGRTLSDVRLQAQQFMEESGDTPWDSLCRVYNQASRPTGKFARGDNIIGFGRDKNVEEFAFRANVGAVSNIIDNDNFYGVCKLKDRYPEGIPPVTDVWSTVVMALKTDMGADSALTAMKLIQLDIQAGKTLEEAAQAAGREAVETNFFGRFDNIPGFGSDPAFRGIAFSLTTDNPLSPIIRAADKYCILEFLDQTTADPEQYAQQRDSLYQVVLGGKQNQMYQLWYNDLYEKAEVQDFRYQLPEGY